ncbi:MAG: hypothetical protein MPW15_11550 [Candidatus Manganitrophus sp.]|nr:hypothetical protein [Candidatus Manganitrophus sp.]
MPRKKKEAKPDFVPLEIPDRIDMNYRYSYGGISPFFRAIKEEAKFLGSRCARCKKTYLPPGSTVPNVTVPRNGSHSAPMER